MTDTLHMQTSYTLPLFPLGLVLFPQGVLPLRIFEARYLDMVKNCLRHNSPFGVVAVTDEKAHSNDRLPFASIGCTSLIQDVDASEPGLMSIHCHGGNKFKVTSAKQQADGLWMAEVEDCPPETQLAVPEDLSIAKTYMQELLDSLTTQAIEERFLPMTEPYAVDDCAWLANRWSEILAMPLVQKQRLLALDSPLVRLELVHDLLSNVIKA